MRRPCSVRAAWSRCPEPSTGTRSTARSWRWADGTHKLPVSSTIRRAIGKDEGDEVTVRLTRRRS
ncbi:MULTISPECIES: DUF1905 domain-containing protein [unclassified Microbacterium]|uniref:DUF1905 domain-containing protein n=1 Tax=unclassified Microbacterium TaxID=2609290 RepID=UPI00364ADE08